MKTNSNWGGAREGSGKKKKVKNHSDALKDEVNRGLKAMAKRTGIGYGEILVRMAYDPKVQDAVRLGAQKLIADILVIKESRQEVEVTREVKPQVYLPEPLPKPQEAKDREKAAASVVH